MGLRIRSLLVAMVFSLVAAGATILAAGQSQTQSQTQPPQSQSQGTQQSTSQDQAQPPQSGRDDAAARDQLLQAKQALSDLIALPQAAQLQGPQRAAINQVISSFNGLLTANTNWYDRYRDVQNQLAQVLGSSSSTAAGETGTSGAAGSQSGSSGAVGTSGTTGTSSSSSVNLPEPIKDKLRQFQQHIVAFAQAAGASGSDAAAGTSGSSSSYGSQSGTSSSSPTQSGSSSSQSGMSGQSSSANGETMQQHFDAIGDLVQQALSGQGTSSSSSGATGTSGSTSGTTGTGTSGTSGSSGTSGTSAGTSSSSGTVSVDRATLEQIQAHLQRLREIARQKGIQ